MQLLKRTTLRGWAVAALLAALLLVAVSGRYTLYTKGPNTYRLDRWTGRVVDLYSLNAPKPEPEPFRPLRTWDPVVIGDTQLALSTKWIEGEAWYHVVLSGAPSNIDTTALSHVLGPRSPTPTAASPASPAMVFIPKAALSEGGSNRYDYQIDLMDADNFRLGTISIDTAGMTPIVGPPGGPCIVKNKPCTVYLEAYGRYPIKVTTYDSIHSAEVRSAAYNKP